MKKSDSIVELAAALVAAQAEMPVIPFDSKNPFLKSSYASLGATIEKTRPILAKHDLAILQFPTSRCTQNLEGPEAQRQLMIQSKIEGQIADLQTELQQGRTAEIEQQLYEVIALAGRYPMDSIGVVSILVHKSGQFIEEVIYLNMFREKGKSLAQVAGSVVSYLRRYAWGAILGLYADEDVDGGNAGAPAERPQGGARPARTGEEEMPFEALPAKGAASTPQPAPQSSPQGQLGPAVRPKITELRQKLQKLEAEFVRCLRNRPADKEGRTVLLPEWTLDQLPDAWADRFLAHFEEELGSVEAWCNENPPPPRTAPEAWRLFPMPWGEKKGQPLRELEVKYIFGLWANYKVTPKTSQGREKTPAQLAEDTLFRKMLDEAGQHYQFK